MNIRTSVQVTGLFLSLACAVACSSSNDTPATSYSGGDISSGKTAVATRACASCHGADLSGTTTPYASTMAYPANLTPDTDTGLGEWDATTIATAILSGKDDEGKSLCSVMPRFSSMGMSDQEAANIVAYLKSLPPVTKMIPETTCPSASAGSGS